MEVKEPPAAPHRKRSEVRGPPPLTQSQQTSGDSDTDLSESERGPEPPSCSPLQQYLQKLLLLLEGLQLQSVQEERGKLQVTSSAQRSAAAASARLSSPKCLLQCQRAFSCSFLSPHTTFSPRSVHTAGCCPESSLSPPQPSRGVLPVPKRSYSESRVQSSDRVPGPPRFCSPSSSYLRRMQASGNLRHPDQGAAGGPRSAHRSGDHTEEGRVSDCRKRSGSEQRTSRTKSPQKPSENRQSRSECRKGRAERRRAADFKNKRMKAPTVPQTLNRFPCSRCCQITGPSRSRAAELVLEQQV